MSNGFLDKFDAFMTQLGKSGYESDHTQFMQQYLQKHPEQLDERVKGRALWWDKKPVPLDEASKTKAASVPTRPYYYQPD